MIRLVSTKTIERLEQYIVQLEGELDTCRAIIEAMSLTERRLIVRRDKVFACRKKAKNLLTEMAELDILLEEATSQAVDKDVAQLASLQFTDLGDTE